MLKTLEEKQSAKDSKLVDKTESQMQYHADMLRDVRNILEWYDVTPILSNSALLEGYRSGNFMPWQYGKVFIVNTEEIQPKAEIIKRELHHANFMITRDFQKLGNFKITAKKDLFCIEITGYYHDAAVGLFLRKVGGKRKAVPEKFYLPPYKKITIRSEEYTIPHDTEEYIKLLYGENWRTPIRSRVASKYRSKELYQC